MKTLLVITASLAVLGLASCVGPNGTLGNGQLVPRVNVEEVERQTPVSPTPNPTGVVGYDNSFGSFHGHGRGRRY